MSARPRSAPSLDWLPILLGQGIGVLCGLIGVRLISAWVPAEVLGFYGLFLVLTPLGSLFTHAGLAKHAAWHWPAARNRQGYLRELWRASLGPGLVLTGCVIVCWISADFLKVQWSSPALWLCLWLASLGTAYTVVFQSALQSARSYWRDATLTTISSIGRTFFPLLCYFFFSPTLLALAGGFALQAFVSASWSYFSLRLTLPKYAAQVSSPTPAFSHFHQSYALAGIFTVVNAGMNRWIGAYLLSPADLGHFALASNISIVLPNVLSGVCWQYFFPRMLAVARRTQREVNLLKLLNQALALFLSAAVVVAVALRWLLPDLVGTLIDRKYAGALDYILPLYAHGVALAIAFYYQGLLHAAGIPRASVMVTAVATVLLTGGGLLAAAQSVPIFLLWLWATPFVLLLALRPLAVQLLKRASPGQPAAELSAAIEEPRLPSE